MLSKRAEQQLGQLEDYITAKAGPATARRYVDAVLATCSSLALFPERGSLHPELRPNVRITHHQSRTAIVFVVHSTTVRILGIYHGGRNYLPHLT